MSNFIKTGNQSAIEWLYYGDSSSTISAGLHNAAMIGIGVLGSKPIKKMVSNAFKSGGSSAKPSQRIAPPTNRVIQ